MSPIHSEDARPGRRGYTTRWPLFLVLAALLAWALAGCAPSVERLQAVYYAPVVADDWEVSDPGSQGLDPLLLARLYHDAQSVATIESLLVIKNGFLVGIALDSGYLAGLDQKTGRRFHQRSTRRHPLGAGGSP